MNLLLLDHESMGLDLALRAQQAGHSVILANGFDGDRTPARSGEGLVPKTLKWQSKMAWADLILMTGNGRWLSEIDSYHKKGYPIFGPNKLAADLELDRCYGQQVLSSCGVETLPFTNFEDYREAESFVFKTLKRYVSKPHGDRAKNLSYVSKNPADMIYMLRRWQRTRPAQEGFFLQEFQAGIEMAVGGWFGPSGWVGPWCESFECKKLMPGDLGVNTGEMGTPVKYVKDSQLADRVLKPCESVLHALNYIGYVDINCIIDKRGCTWPLEWTARLGWPLTHAQTALHLGDPIAWMADLIEGKDSLTVSYNHCVCVVVAIPDFPFSKLTSKEVEGVPIYGIDKENRDSIHPCNLMKGNAPAMKGEKVIDTDLFVTADDYPLVVSGTGSTVSRAKKAAYEVVGELEIPNSPLWRVDISDRLEKELPELQKHGFALNWRWV